MSLMTTPEVLRKYLLDSANFYEQTPFLEIEEALIRHYLKVADAEPEFRALIRKAQSRLYNTKVVGPKRLETLTGLSIKRLESMINHAYTTFGYDQSEIRRYIIEQREGYNNEGDPLMGTVLNHLVPSLVWWTVETRSLSQALEQAEIDSVLPPEIADVKSNNESRPLIHSRGQKALGRQSWR